MSKDSYIKLSTTEEVAQDVREMLPKVLDFLNNLDSGLKPNKRINGMAALVINSITVLRALAGNDFANYIVDAAFEPEIHVVEERPDEIH